MTINIENMEADLLAWEADEKAALSAKVEIRTRCFSLDDAGIGDGAWSKEGAIAFARAMLLPSLEGPGHAPRKVLETLTVLATVTSPELTAAAITFEKSAARRERAQYRESVEKNTIAQGYREGRKRRRSIHNLTAAPGTSHVYQGVTK